MPNRFIFRQTYYADLPIFLSDGEIRAKNHPNMQLCHQTSYQELVNRRGTDEFKIPCGGVVNDYVQFYFSPKTAFTYTIHKGNVPLISPIGQNLGSASSEQRIFFVSNTEKFRTANINCYFTDFPLNSQSPFPSFESDLSKLEQHIHWDVFDEQPSGSIPEIGYAGVCQYFQDRADPEHHRNRSKKRMAEFLVKDALPLGLVDCIIANNKSVGDTLNTMMAASEWDIPVLVKPYCYFS